MNIQPGDVIHCPSGGIMIKDFIDDETVFGYEYPWICCELPFVIKVKDIREENGKLVSNSRGKTTMFPYNDEEEWYEKNEIIKKLERLRQKEKKYIDRIAELDKVIGKRKPKLKANI